MKQVSIAPNFADLEPGEEITYILSDPNTTQQIVWTVPVEPRVRVIRAGRQRTDWRTIQHAAAGVAGIAGLLFLLFHWPTARSARPRTMSPRRAIPFPATPISTAQAPVSSSYSTPSRTVSEIPRGAYRPQQIAMPAYSAPATPVREQASVITRPYATPVRWQPDGGGAPIPPSIPLPDESGPVLYDP